MKRLLTYILVLLFLLSCIGPFETAFGDSNDHKHQWSDWIYDSRGHPCLDGGIASRYCTVPGCSEYEQKDFPARGHNFGAWSYKTKPTCTEEGYGYHECSRCGFSESTSIPALGHSYSWTVIDPTCTEMGHKTGVCVRCGREWGADIDALGHDWGNWKTIELPDAATGKPGYEERECKRCHITERNPLYAPGQEPQEGAPALLLELITDTSGMTVSVGEEVTVLYRITNTGESYVYVNSMNLRDKYGNIISGSEDGWDTAEDNPEEYLAPGASCEITHRVVIKGTDGFGRMIWMDGLSWYDKDGARALTREDCDHNDKNFIKSNIVRFEFREDDGNPALKLELLTDTSDMAVSVGDEVTVLYRITNTGKSYVYVNSMNLRDKYGNIIHGSEDGWDTAEDNPEEYLAPGASCEITHRVVIKGTDGFGRMIWMDGLSWYDKAGARALTREDCDHKDKNFIKSNIVKFEFRDIEEGNPKLRLWTRVLNPKPYYELGDKIRIEVELENVSDKSVFNPNMHHNMASTWAQDWIAADIDELQEGDSYFAIFEDVIGEIEEGADKDYETSGGYYIATFNGGAYTSSNESDPDFDVVHSNTSKVKVPVFESSDTKLKLRAKLLLDGQTYGTDDDLFIEWTLTNMGDEPIKGIVGTWAEDASFGWGIFVSYDDNPNEFMLEPNESMSDVFGYTVTPLDSLHDEIVFTLNAQGYTPNGDDVFSNEELVAVEIGLGPKDADKSLGVSKFVTSTPGEGRPYYIEGEVIRYEVEVTNTSDEPVFNIYVKDELKERETGSAYLDELGCNLEPGESRRLGFDYTVTHEDCVNGSVLNRAVAECTISDDSGRRQEKFISGLVEVPTQLKPEENVTVTKTLVDSGSEGPFTEGEKVKFHVTITNNLPVTLTDVYARDLINEEYYEDLGEIDDLLPYADYSFDFDYEINCVDCSFGTVTDRIEVKYRMPESANLDEAMSNMVFVKTTLEKDIPQLDIEKKVVSVSADPTFYAEGETVMYEITVTNNSGLTAYKGSIHDILYPDGPIDYFELLENGESMTVSFEHTVTHEEAYDTLAVYNQAQAVYYADKEGTGDKLTNYSDIIRVPAGHTEPLEEPEVLITKFIGNPPIDGDAYQWGETIHFEIMITNNSPYTLSYGSLYDHLDSYSHYDTLVGFFDVAPYDWVIKKFDYTVQEGDVKNIKYINNYADFNFVIEGFDDEFLITSDIVEAPVKDGEPIDGDYPYITKYLMNTPGGGRSYFVENETVMYMICVTNPTDYDWGYTEVFDSLIPIEQQNYLGTIPMLPAHSDYYFPFFYTVTKEDVENGKVYNEASMEVLDSEDCSEYFISNVVIVDTGRLDEGSDGIADACVPTYRLFGGGAGVLETKYCALHGKVEKQAYALISAAATDEEKSAAYIDIKQLWLSALDAEYEEQLNNATDHEAAIIAEDKETFLVQLAQYEKTLKAMNLDETMVYKAITELIRGRVTELCYENAYAPEKRQDSLFNYKGLEAATAQVEKCFYSVDGAGSDRNTVIIEMCRYHASGASLLTGKLLAAQSAEELETAQAMERNFWVSEARNLYKKLAEASGLTDTTLFDRDVESFINMIEKREAQLSVMYPNDKALVNELAVRLIIERVTYLDSIK